MSKCNELRKLLLEWGEDNYLPLKKKNCVSGKWKLSFENAKFKNQRKKWTTFNDHHERKRGNKPMKIDRGIVQCDRCKRVFKTKEVNNYKISYQAGGLKSDGGCGLVTKKAEICSDCNMDFDDFMRNKPVAGRDNSWQVKNGQSYAKNIA